MLLISDGSKDDVDPIGTTVNIAIDGNKDIRLQKIGNGCNFEKALCLIGANN